MTFQCRMFAPPSAPGFQWPHVSDPVTTDCLYSQLRLVYFCHSLQRWREAYVTQRTVQDHWRRCLPESDRGQTHRFPPPPHRADRSAPSSDFSLRHVSSLEVWLNGGKRLHIALPPDAVATNHNAARPHSLKLILCETRRSETKRTTAAPCCFWVEAAQTVLFLSNI